MAVHVFTDAFISVAGTDLSARCVGVSIDDGYDEIDAQAMSNTAKNVIVGQRDQVIKASFLQDYAASSTHATLHAARGTAVAVIVRPDSGAVSTTNPQWSGTLLLPRYNPVGATVNDKQVVEVEFKTQGTALTYATA